MMKQQVALATTMQNISAAARPPARFQKCFISSVNRWTHKDNLSGANYALFQL